MYDAYVLKNYARAPVTLVRGSGTTVWDDQGKSYLDFSSGIAVTSIGHCHPRWVAAIQRQAAELVHVSNLFRTPNQGELARRIVGYAGPGRVFFCNSGGEADEALIKLSRLHGVRKSGVEGKCIRVVCAKNGFHGRMFGGMSATPKESVQKGFRPLLPGFVFGELNNLDSFASLVDADTTAVLVESIQGDGGINPCTSEFLVGLRRLCDERGLLLLADEVQCGAGRTGRFFAFEHAGIRPDAIAMAKGLAGGFPIGAVWVGERAADLFQPGMHGSTFGGTPLACAAALAVLDVIEGEGLLAHVTRESAPWIAELGKLAADFPGKVLEIRGRGFLVGVQMASDSAPTLAALREHGLLTAPAGVNVIRLLPPLVATRDELARSVAIFRDVLAAG
jgi:acetylornithine aminotransferase/acetylornithine/N-succinyldiaminopimelate aminotransferase